jgi:hypothetical protein
MGIGVRIFETALRIFGADKSAGRLHSLASSFADIVCLLLRRPFAGSIESTGEISG